LKKQLDERGVGFGDRTLFLEMVDLLMHFNTTPWKVKKRTMWLLKLTTWAIISSGRTKM
jgi:hypothetical protein